LGKQGGDRFECQSPSAQWFSRKNFERHFVSDTLAKLLHLELHFESHDPAGLKPISLKRLMIASIDSGPLS